MKRRVLNRRQARRASIVVLAIGVLGWAASHIVHVTWYGDAVSMQLSKGCFGLYAGQKPEYRNTFILNGFTWPGFGHGAGGQWSVEQWGRWAIYGPEHTLSRRALVHHFEYPRNLGFFAPGLSWGGQGLGYVGVPFWLPVSVGGAGLIVTRRRRAAHGCAQCGYDLRGLRDARCTECGADGSRSARISPPGFGCPDAAGV